jgi:hypothetical protein
MIVANKRKIWVAGGILTILLILTACGTVQPSTTNSSAPQSLKLQVNVALVHAPVGTSTLAWNAQTMALTVKVSLSGLAPNSTHPEHIHAGNCSVDGAIIYTLKPLVANSLGVGTSETTITQVKGGIPASGWHVNVHDGPQLSSALQMTPIACGNVVNTQKSASVTVPLVGTSAANQNASGNTQLSLANSKLTVKITMSGLAPNSTHMAHIHSGSCTAQGGVLYPLNPVVADAKGNGTSTTTLNKITTIPQTGWYVNVHDGASTSDLSTQTGFDPIACGNIVIS